MSVTDDDFVDLQKIRDANHLIRQIVDNQQDILKFAYRLATRFHMVVIFSSDGRPHAIGGQPLNIGTQPPYWCRFDYLLSPHLRKPVPSGVTDEGRALISQGIRLRNQMLGIFPDIPKEYLFPLNLQGAA